MNGTVSSHGDGSTDPIETLDQFIERTRTQYVRRAKRWIRRFGIDEIRLSDEGAVHEACLKLLERAPESQRPPVRMRAELEKEFPVILRNVIVDAGRRQNADKRACAEMQSLASAADVVDPHAVPPDKRVIAEEELHLLGREFPILRDVAIMKMEGFSNAMIATQLHVSASKFGRVLREVRSILKRHRDDDK
jgi:DNA-directed RNA polymerase specialized sigma24 family protein